MKPFVFATENLNYYLYAPEIKKFIAIPESSYVSFRNKDILNDKVLSRFSECGYLDTSIQSYSRKIEPYEIEYSLANIPQIVFEVTTQCNFKCKYCCFGENYQTFSDRKSGTLNFENAKILLDYISSLTFSKLNNCSNSPLVLSFYGGEPLLNVSLIKKIVRYAKELKFKNRTLYFSLTTNGSLLAENIDFLQENQFTILVSLDGDEYISSHRIFKNGKPTYKDVVSNLLFVKEKFPEYFKSIRYNSVFTNLSNIEILFDFFEKNIGKIPTVSPLHISDGETITNELKGMLNKIPIATKELLNKFPNAFLEFPINKRLVQLLMYMTDSLYYNELSFVTSEYSFPTFPTHTCIPFTKRIFLSVEGNIMPCEKVSRHKPLAQIIDGVLQFDFSYISNHFNDAVRQYSLLCSSCALELLCNHCAYTSSKIKGCPDYKSYDEIEKILGELFTYIENNPSVLKSALENIILK